MSRLPSSQEVVAILRYATQWADYEAMRPKRFTPTWYWLVLIGLAACATLGGCLLSVELLRPSLPIVI